MLFFGSLFFYAWGEPKYILIMLFSTVFDYVNGLLLLRFDQSEKKRRAVVVVSIIGNLLILIFFKYTDFFIANINVVAGTQIPLLKILLPIGISFYTFQTMSYTIDVYRRQTTVQKNIISFGTYVVMFPQLIAGPIVRYKTIAEELDDRSESFSEFSQGLSRFFCGLSKKVLLANNIGYLWSAVRQTPISEMSVLLAWLGIAAFSLQIYFDFSGYSDMAIGIGRMFGFHFPENFNYPYTSKSVTEFWRRWHMTLGEWFREYVYIPLGGNKVASARVYFNIFVVWILTGLWHGASWNFAIWGLYYCVLLVIEKVFLLRLLQRTPTILRHTYVVLSFLIGWVFFELTTMSEALGYLGVMFGLSGLPLVNSSFLYYFFSYLPSFIIMTAACTPICKNLAERFFSGRLYLLRAIIGLLAFFLCTAYLVDSSYNPFLYFRF